MKVQASRSEDAGIAALTDDDLRVLSVGISTGGVAEIRMAQLNPKRHIVATTIDKQGIEFARKFISKKSLDKQIETRLEDVAEPLPYSDGRFDYIYARLVLHYLPKDKLEKTLKELNRVLKTGGKLFVVVRSTECTDAKRPDAQYDPITHLTSCTDVDKKTGKTYSYSRYFHTEGSMSGYVARAGFEASYVESYDEKLFKDFMRTVESEKTDNVIELLAVKK